MTQYGAYLETGQPYISPSQINTLLTCPAKWHYQYREGLKTGYNENLVTGIAVHEALEESLKAEIEDTQYLPYDVGQIAKGKYLEFLERDDVTVSAHDPIHVEKAGECAANLWAWYQTSGFRVKHVEYNIRDSYQVGNDDVALVGRLDVYGTLVDGRKAVLDWKTAGKSPPQRDGVYVLDRKHALAQLLYAAALREPVDVVLTVTATTAKQVRVCVAEQVVSQELLDWAKNVARGAIALIQSGALYPNPTSYTCSERYCAAWTVCPGSPSKLGGDAGE